MSNKIMAVLTQAVYNPDGSMLHDAGYEFDPAKDPVLAPAGRLVIRETADDPAPVPVPEPVAAGAAPASTSTTTASAKTGSFKK
jgi:hypothetical protein